MLLGVSLALLALTETYQPYIPAVLGMLVVTCAVRSLRTRRFLPRTRAELPLAVFLASAALSTWVAYDRPLALLQFTRLLGTAVTFYTVVESSPAVRRLAAVAVVLASIGLGGYFILRHDFSADTGKFAAITAFGRWMNAALPALPGPTVHPNVASGGLILGIPLTAALAAEAWKQRRTWLAVLAGLLALIGLAELMLTSSRGAWLGLAGALGLLLLAWIQRRWLGQPKAAAAFWLGWLALALIAALALAQAGLLDRLLGQIPDTTGSLHSRTVLWKQGVLLARDYTFTGIGLLSFPMVFSIYTLLIHPVFISHTHNTYLQVLVEQGWPGFLALLGLGLAGLRWAWALIRRSSVPLLAWGGLVTLSAVALHGLVDVTLYLSRTLPLVGLVAGLLASEYESEPLRMGRRKKILVPAAALAILVVGAIFWRPLAAAAYANLGAVEQTRLELGQYDPEHFDAPTLDKIRQEIDLSTAEAAFHQAQALAPNLTAWQRLAEIALSRGQYAAALDGMQAAWQNGARDEVTRLLYGDALVANGQLEAAARTVGGLAWAEGRLMFQAYYRYTLGKDVARALAAWQTVLLLNPGNAQAPGAIADLRKQLPSP